MADYKKAEQKELLMKDVAGRSNAFEDHISEIIRKSREKGDFDNLDGQGKPMELAEDDPFVPEEDRMAHRVMKNAGIAPRWVQWGDEIEAKKERLQSLGAEKDPAKEEAILKLLAEMNDLIGKYNMSCPISFLHKRKWKRIERPSPHDSTASIG